MTGNEARKIFLEYFKKHNHRHVRSSSLVPQDDPTLLFVNAGMVQFKRVFTGDEKRDYSTAVTSQKCVRAGGKHNDLENVGYTARHHTFFEMLGNFSFGEYFKEKAIDFAWDLLTNGYGFDAEKLYVSVYKDDDQAFDIWNKQIGLPSERISRLGDEDNFWAMGDTGPCGPCSEIHIDRGKEFGCDDPNCAVGCDCDRWLELWNLVFMQFERSEDGTMTPLPKPSIDTGMGLERIISVLQDVPTNFDTDLFVPIMDRVGELAGKKRGESKEVEVAMKVIADHSRASAFLICDGVMPSNEGRGYVLRRIMRRAIRYGRSIGLTQSFLHKTVQTVFSIMDDAYPELKESAAFILNVVKNEEEKFLETLETGMKLLEATVEDLEKRHEKIIPGEVIFKLYDTFGFPVDIIQDHVKEMDITLDLDGFDAAMAEQKARSKSKKKFAGVGDAYKPLTSAGVKTVFKGYDAIEMQSDLLIVVKDDAEVDIANAGDEIEVVTSQTVFYAESGGQAGDKGLFENDSCAIEITDTVKDPSGLFIHKGKVVKGACKKGDTFTLKVDAGLRRATAANHSATHILHAALRKVLGDHVKQSGSLVTPDRLRFDFTHFSAATPEELAAIEIEVNTRIIENHAVTTKEMDMDEAVRSGATALFEEKYGDVVRVVSQGDFSQELCGGTHTRATGDIGLFRILSEGGIASGVRRIEAVTGLAALEAVHADQLAIEKVAGVLKSAKDDVVDRLESFAAEKKAAEKELAALKAKIASKSVENIDDDIRQINGVKVLAKRVEIENPSQLRDLADKFKTKLGSGVLLLGAESNGKALLISMVTDDLTKTFKAGNIVKTAAGIVGGGGGGRPDMAQAGGTKPEFLDKALESVFDTVSK
ncbi:alanine--tRNA ligase [Desulfobacter hydrogenophilus]|uniref:Alanine--tRNA ligase n=1 Tax=Desulfobacter hydrogenophilus TaxID=2291 RepID=A0A328FI67_9BACT|nr:alanine--tRNA ligase [Desulfobacter hydrogenophilus]NDY71213.1 alanine--tRNA ligase [Desulfobacter hydrogenophilus]QBH15046.1 alanine--tRNA ligase [Desulfobacter hydrogenophilus]RAM02707.1 alanine--tRNA ligase [Desulfobacter hydrogenophilus]